MPPYDGVSGLEALLSGESEWRNIQSILKTTFEAVASILASHAELLENLDARLDRLQDASPTTRDGLAQLQSDVRKLAKRAVSHHELDARVAAAVDQMKRRLEHAVSPGVEANDAVATMVLERANEVFATKEELAATRRAVEGSVSRAVQPLVSASISDVEKRLATKLMKRDEKEYVRNAQLEELVAFKAAIEPEVRALAKRLPDLIESHGSWQADVKKELLRQRAQRDDAMSKLAADCQAQLRQRAMASDVKLVVAGKVDRDEFQDARHHGTMANEALEARVLEQEEALRRAVAGLKAEFGRLVDTKCAKADVVKIFARKANQDDVQAWLAEKVSHDELRDVCTELIHATTKQTAEVQAEVHDELRRIEATVGDRAKDLHEHIAQSVETLQHQVRLMDGWKLNVDELQSQLVTKMGIKDTCTLLDAKSNISDVNDALAALQERIATKADDTDVRALGDDLGGLRRQMRGELCLGRWIWKHGRPTERQTILWNSQIVNTSPDIFVWDKGSDTITLELPGLYQLQAGFFTDYNPTIHVLVNGEPAFAFPRSESVVHFWHCAARSSKNDGRRLRHSAGNVTGVSVCEFLALPPRATLSISYDIDERAQACLTLRKL
ncbi:hypothetical protein ACHHYP_13266 [Achlya hypogyna]|uniref:Uncharacterized protein n=1 Tax=Achlya hypogyna TaxID=1202772 RepID=A0A1V9YFK0_ACHHY|nr:hypothetical protein ACHHYP_13266 [Achlya hypogyna]